MENNSVLVMVRYWDSKRVNNKAYNAFCEIEEQVKLDRRFLSNLESVVSAFKELGSVEVRYGYTVIGTLEKGSYRVGEEEKTFERFGGKIAKDFYNAIDDKISELESK